MQKYANLVELEKCCQTHIFLQNFILIQPRTSPPKICTNLLIFPICGGARTVHPVNRSVACACAASQLRRLPSIALARIFSPRDLRYQKNSSTRPYFSTPREVSRRKETRRHRGWSQKSSYVSALRTPVNNIKYFPPNFEGLVL